VAPAVHGGEVPPQALKLVTGEAYSQKWIVILGSFTDPGEVPGGISKLARHPDLFEQVARISSTRFKGLMPCYQVVIAGAFATRKEARAHWKRLKKLGVKSYFKNAGKWVKQQPGVEAYCERRGKKSRGACGGLHWVEKHAKRIFMKLQVDDVVAERIKAKTGASRPLDASLDVWGAPVRNKVVGVYRKGAGYQVFEADRSQTATTCTIGRFHLLTRGTPHFGWYQEFQQSKKKPMKPGCGSPELFAELSCSEELDRPQLAVARGESPLKVYERGSKLSPEVVAALEKVFRQSGSYPQSHKQAEKEAGERKEKLVEEFGLSVYRQGTRTVVLAKVLLKTGQGETACGAEDVRVDMVGLAELKDARILHPLEAVDESTIQGVVSTGAKGDLYLLEQLFPNTRRLKPLGHDRHGCEITIDFCDCGC
jgi:hypothetical protein